MVYYSAHMPKYVNCEWVGFFLYSFTFSFTKYFYMAKKNTQRKKVFLFKFDGWLYVCTNKNVIILLHFLSGLNFISIYGYGIDNMLYNFLAKIFLDIYLYIYRGILFCLIWFESIKVMVVVSARESKNIYPHRIMMWLYRTNNK